MGVKFLGRIENSQLVFVFIVGIGMQAGRLQFQVYYNFLQDVFLSVVLRLAGEYSLGRESIVVLFSGSFMGIWNYKDIFVIVLVGWG